mmetsp:Transcript_26445/g.77724  ORF Transcript_26445/g.77724 Transcript_26445/m.77724 type:complete len:223 (+) Transcript_26445:150-818(+)
MPRLSGHPGQGEHQERSSHAGRGLAARAAGACDALRAWSQEGSARRWGFPRRAGKSVVARGGGSQIVSGPRPRGGELTPMSGQRGNLGLKPGAAAGLRPGSADAHQAAMGRSVAGGSSLLEGAAASLRRRSVHGTPVALPHAHGDGLELGGRTGAVGARGLEGWREHHLDPGQGVRGLARHAGESAHAHGHGAAAAGLGRGGCLRGPRLRRRAAHLRSVVGM